MPGGQRGFFRDAGAPAKRRLTRQAARHGFDRAIAVLAEHGHAQVLAYPYSVFVQALKLHDKKE